MSADSIAWGAGEVVRMQLTGSSHRPIARHPRGPGVRLEGSRDPAGGPPAVQRGRRAGHPGAAGPTEPSIGPGYAGGSVPARRGGPPLAPGDDVLAELKHGWCAGAARA